MEVFSVVHELLTLCKIFLDNFMCIKGHTNGPFWKAEFAGIWRWNVDVCEVEVGVRVDEAVALSYPI